MAAIALADTGFLVGLLRARDRYREWAAETTSIFPPPWQTCEAVVSEAFHLLGPVGRPALIELLRRRFVTTPFQLTHEREPVLLLMQRYADVPMSLADACLVRMTEMHTDPLVITTDSDFRIYRRHGRRVVPCVLPD